MTATITMTTLGKNGRFGNQIFQYAFLKIYALKYHLSVQTPNWIGQELFGHNDSFISSDWPLFRENEFDFAESLLSDLTNYPKNIDLFGYFLYHTKYYVPNQSFFYSLFQPTINIERNFLSFFDNIKTTNRTLIGLHLRRGDFGYDDYFIAPCKWYNLWLKKHWKNLKNPLLFIASDEPQKVVKSFSKYESITSKDLGINLEFADFYLDFYILSKCDILAISNSTFSFAAAMLNINGKLFLRPDYFEKRLIVFEPWNSEPFLRGAKIRKNFILNVLKFSSQK